MVKKAILIIGIFLLSLTGCNDNKSNLEHLIISQDVSGEKTKVINGYIIYQEESGDFLYDPVINKDYIVPQDLTDSKFASITNDSTISVKYDYESSTIIIYTWNFKLDTLSQRDYQLNEQYYQFLDVEYLDGEIFIALDSNNIIKIDYKTEKVQLFKIEDSFNLAYINDFLLVHDNELYAIFDREIIYQFDKDKNKFVKLSPSPTIVNAESIYYINNDNSITAIKGPYEKEFTLPSIPEDNSLHKENSYYVIDSYNDSFLIKRFSLPNGSLFVYANDELKEVPIVDNKSPIAQFINENEFLYSDEDNLYLYDISKSQKTLILENISPHRIERVKENNKAIYIAITHSNNLDIIKIDN